jgi:anti-sigma B factor antagonist
MAANPVTTPVLKLETETTPAQVTVRCSGRLVSDTCEQLQNTARAIIPTTKRLILDLTEVNYLDSSALGTIVGLYISSKRAGCQLKLTNLTPRVKELLSITRLTEVLESHAKEEMFGITPE